MEFSNKTYIGLVYLLELDSTPQLLFSITENEMKKKNWLVDLLLKNIKIEGSFTECGTHVLLTSKKVFSLQDYEFYEPSGEDGEIVYTDDDICEMFSKN
jgi:hypothetical protein